MDNEVDLSISGGDLVFDASGEPVLVEGADVVAQDIKHRLVESGLPNRLIGANPFENEGIKQSMRLKVEEDVRIVPGQTKVFVEGGSKPGFTARSFYGDIKEQL